MIFNNRRGLIVFTYFTMLSFKILALDYTYSSDGSEITITGYTGSNPNIVIPDTIDGLPVTIIGSGAFKNYTTITSVVLPVGLESIDNHAFTNLLIIIST